MCEYVCGPCVVAYLVKANAG